MDNVADILIRGGIFFSMAKGGSPRTASVAIKDGRVAVVLPPDAELEAECVYDASGCFVTPGFVDSHMHDEYFPDPDTAQQALIRQGVTTAIGGHCGSGPPVAISFAARPKPWLNLGYMAGNCAMREAVGRKDRYSPASAEEVAEMRAILRESLRQGAMGLSLGLEYAPGASEEEISALAEVLSEFPDSFISAHIRYDDKRCVDAVREVIALASEHKLRLQVSHLGSMTMNRTHQCVDVIDAAYAAGVDVGLDCYPYDAFCAKAGSAVYDGNFEERWEGKGPESLEAASGRFKGQRLTYETLAVMRAEEPMDLIIAHVMNKGEVDACITHPKGLVASDALYTGGGGHPRIAGTFPRALGILRGNGFGWWDALSKMTCAAADRLRIEAGRLAAGSVADVIVFDPARFRDRATFQEPLLPPEGLRLVVINGKTALRDGELAKEPSGRILRRKTPAPVV